MVCFLLCVAGLSVDNLPSNPYMSTVPHSAGQSRIFIRCPPFLENGITIFFVADFSTFLPRKATK